MSAETVSPTMSAWDLCGPTAQARQGDKDGDMNGPIGVPQKAETRGGGAERDRGEDEGLKKRHV